MNNHPRRSLSHEGESISQALKSLNSWCRKQRASGQGPALFGPPPGLLQLTPSPLSPLIFVTNSGFTLRPDLSLDPPLFPGPSDLPYPEILLVPLYVIDVIFVTYPLSHQLSWSWSHHHDLFESPGTSPNTFLLVSLSLDLPGSKKLY